MMNKQKKIILGISILLMLTIVFMIMCQRFFSLQRLKNMYQDFDVSMMKTKFPQRFQSPHENKWYATFKALYEKNNFHHLSPLAMCKIPKIIHQIWIGSSFPKKYKKFQDSWKKYHPDWLYILWTSKELRTLHMQNRVLFDTATNYGEKSDIARCEILYQFGGLYVDTDFECIKNFADLHHYYNFYIGIQPLDTNCVQLGIGIIGTVAKHPLIKKYLDHLPENTARWKQIIYRTGPLYFTNIFIEYCNESIDNRIIALPASYFYPRGYLDTATQRSQWLKNESFAIHHWEGSWIK